MQYCIDYVFVRFDSRESILFTKEEKFSEKQENKAIKFYEKFKDKTKKWLNITGQYRHTRCDFHGLYKIVKRRKIIVCK